jgi:hypothetical protein
VDACCFIFLSFLAEVNDMLTEQLPSATPRLMVLAVVVLVHILLLYLLLFFPRFQGGSSCMRSSQAYEAVLPHQHNLQVPFPPLIKRGRPATPQPSASLVGMSHNLTDNTARDASPGSKGLVKDLVKDLVNHWQLDVLPVAWSAFSSVHFQPASQPACHCHRGVWRAAEWRYRLEIF